jgi:hypothetical protein
MIINPKLWQGFWPNNLCLEKIDDFPTFFKNITRIIMQEMSNEIFDIENNNAKRESIEIVEC